MRKREVDGDASVLQEKFLERDLVVRDEDVLPFEDLRLDPVPVEASHGIEVDGAKQQSRVAHKVGGCLRRAVSPQVCGRREDAGGGDVVEANDEILGDGGHVAQNDRVDRRLMECARVFKVAQRGLERGEKGPQLRRRTIGARVLVEKCKAHLALHA